MNNNKYREANQSDASGGDGGGGSGSSRVWAGDEYIHESNKTVSSTK